MASWLTSAIVGILAVAWFAGCGTCQGGSSRPFEFGRDQFAFRNELQRTYTFEDGGKMKSHRTEPPPEYSLRCFSMVRAAREFHYHARFKPEWPKVDEAEYRRLVRAIVARDSRRPAATAEKIIIPGFASLKEFSGMHPSMVKEHCGSKWNSYTQRGNWRMVFPISRGHQVRTADALRDKLEHGLLPIVHVVDFPGLKINHALLVTRARSVGENVLFESYDPNNPERLAELRFDARERCFYFERNQYFSGGAVKVYEVFTSALF